MIILDTNVISEFMGSPPAPAVLAWMNAIRDDQIYLTAITLGELYDGLSRLPHGQRRAGLERDLSRFLVEVLRTPILDFDQGAAELYGTIRAHRLRLGAPISVPDAQIAAIAKAHGLSLATRNTRDFEHTGVPVQNPFADQT